MASSGIRAMGYAAQEVYRSADPAGYAAWVALFPGQEGRWYLSFIENTTPREALPKMTRDQWYAFSIPVGYEQSQYRQEHVLLQSDDGMRTWTPVSRAVHSAAGTFSDVCTRDGRFLRFVWECYSRAPDAHPGSILYESTDQGATWVKQPPFHDRRFASYPHRARTLRDGTIALAIPFSRLWSVEEPRACIDLDAQGGCQMHLCFSADGGRTWSSPVPIYGGQDVSETDFVELPSGDLLCINNSIFARPGRQVVYRIGHGFLPGPYERSRTPDRIPETVCLTEDGLLVGCMRGPWYAVSDDGGLSWEPLAGIPSSEQIRGHGRRPLYRRPRAISGASARMTTASARMYQKHWAQNSRKARRAMRTLTMLRAPSADNRRRFRRPPFRPISARYALTVAFGFPIANQPALT